MRARRFGMETVVEAMLAYREHHGVQGVVANLSKTALPLLVFAGSIALSL